MRLVFRIAAAALMLAAWQQRMAYGQSESLDFVTKPALIECEPEGADLCFRLQFGFIDESGKPVNVRLPSANQLASKIEVQVDGQTVKPFYAVAAAGSAEQAKQPQTTLLLFDVSGSMLK